jgi:L-alanine-DL-glutamate epimerase-like enolase superfamily enzyme
MGRHHLNVVHCIRGGHQVKVTALETSLVSTKGLITQVFVRFTTDEGRVGYGEAGNAFRLKPQIDAARQ